MHGNSSPDETTAQTATYIYSNGNFGSIHPQAETQRMDAHVMHKLHQLQQAANSLQQERDTLDHLVYVCEQARLDRKCGAV